MARKKPNYEHTARMIKSMLDMGYDDFARDHLRYYIKTSGLLECMKIVDLIKEKYGEATYNKLLLDFGNFAVYDPYGTNAS